MKTAIILLIVVGLVLYKIFYPRFGAAAERVCVELDAAIKDREKACWPGDGDPENGGGHMRKDPRPLTTTEVNELSRPAPLRTPFVEVCACPERKKPADERAWLIEHHKHNHSAFHGGYQRSDYSGIVCTKCQKRWRTKAKYVNELSLAPDEETHGDDNIDENEPACSGDSPDETNKMEV